MIRFFIAFLVGILLSTSQIAAAQDAVFDPKTNTTAITFSGNCDAGVSLQPATSYAVTCQSENVTDVSFDTFGADEYTIVGFDNAVYFLAVNNSGQIITLEPGYSYGILVKQNCIYAATEQISVNIEQVGYDGHVDMGSGTVSYSELYKVGLELPPCGS